MESLFYRIEKLKTERGLAQKKLYDINFEMDNLYNELKEIVEKGESKKNEVEIKKEYRRVPKTFLNNYTECRIGIDNDEYNIGDIIHYTGKVYDHNDFYAYIHHITNTNISITLLIKEESNADEEVIFYNTTKEFNGLSSRKFNLFNNQ